MDYNIETLIEQATDAGISVCLDNKENVEQVFGSAFVLESIKEKLDRTNPTPLTLKELMDMTGKPVFVVKKKIAPWDVRYGSGWVIVQWNYVSHIMHNSKDLPELPMSDYGKTWFAYLSER